MRGKTTEKEIFFKAGKTRYRDILDKADLIELKFGDESYPWLSGICLRYARMGGITLEQAAGVVAVLSPMIGWRLNLLAARALILSKGQVAVGPGFRGNYEKARKIVLFNDLSAISGPKVLPFYKTLVDPRCADPVVDTHMLSAFHGRRSYTFDARIYLSRIKVVADVVWEIAEERGWLVSRTQATIWITWKRITRGYGDQLSLWEAGGSDGDGDRRVPDLWSGIPVL